MPCAHNGHKSSPYRLSRSLLILGWSVHELARRTGEHRTTIRRWIDGKAVIDPAIAAWLEELVAFHLDHPPPRRRGLPMVLQNTNPGRPPST